MQPAQEEGNTHVPRAQELATTARNRAAGVKRGREVFGLSRNARQPLEFHPQSQQFALQYPNSGLHFSHGN